MGARQRESRHAVVEDRPRPGVRVMALLTARDREPLLVRHVSRVRRALVLLDMTRSALRRKPLELAAGCTLVAVIALRHRVRADQRKAVVVVLDGLDVHRPSLHAVALFAACTELAAVNISVAVGTLAADIAENHLGMALSAGNAFVHAAQRVACLVVIEFGNRTNGLPATYGVTVLTGDCQVAVRTRGVLGRRALRRAGRRQQ